MPDSKPSLIDYLNLGLTLAIGAGGIWVAITVSRSADGLSANSLMVSTASFLLDDEPKKRQAGVDIITRLRADHTPLPVWSNEFIDSILKTSNVSAPSGPQAPPDEVKAAAPTTPVANQLFTELGGTSPRLFIEVADASQKPGAEALRRVVSRLQLGGQSLAVPGIERVAESPNRIELRFLKKNDATEAKSLTDAISKLLNRPISVVDLSGQFETREDVKPRTYELWFPLGENIPMTVASG
jgi:hypothetical protein